MQQRLDFGLARAVLAVGGPGLILGDRYPQRRAVHPDCPAVHQQRAGRAQRVHELPRRGRCEADQVDHHIRVQRRDPGAEGALGVLRLAVSHDPGDRVPLWAHVVWAAGTTAHGDYFVAAAYQPGHQIATDMPGSSNHNHTAHPQESFHRRRHVTPFWRGLRSSRTTPHCAKAAFAASASAGPPASRS